MQRENHGFILTYLCPKTMHCNDLNNFYDLYYSYEYYDRF